MSFRVDIFQSEFIIEKKSKTAFKMVNRRTKEPKLDDERIRVRGRLLDWEKVKGVNSLGMKRSIDKASWNRA